MTNDEPDRPEAVFVANREIRTVPKGWHHPTRGATDLYAPLLPDQMPDVTGLTPEETEIVAYETTSEGTPVSAPFPNTPQGRLAAAQHCADHYTTWGAHTADAEAWAVILFGEGAAVTADGVVIAND